MGAWGVAPFENDGAGDLVASLRHGDFSFDEWETDEDYLEVDGGQYAIALVEIALVALGKRAAPVELDGVDVASLTAQFTPDRLASIATLADRTLEGPECSELYELWEETDDLDAWRAPALESLGVLRTEIDRLSAG